MNINNDIQQQPDGKELMQMAELVQKALAEEKAAPTPSADEAWKRFADKHGIGQEQKRPTLWRRWGIAACVALACMVVVAMSLPAVRQWVSPKPMVEAGQSSPSPAIAPAEGAEVLESEEGVAFRNVPLDEVLQWVADNYHTQVVNTDATAELRLYVELNRGWSLEECIGFLNRFEHVNLTLTPDNVIVTE